MRLHLEMCLNSVDGRNPANHLISSLSHYSQGLIHPRWLAGFLNHQQYGYFLLQYCFYASETWQPRQLRLCKKKSFKEFLSSGKLKECYQEPNPKKMLLCLCRSLKFVEIALAVSKARSFTTSDRLRCLPYVRAAWCRAFRPKPCTGTPGCKASIFWIKSRKPGPGFALRSPGVTGAAPAGGEPGGVKGVYPVSPPVKRKNGETRKVKKKKPGLGWKVQTELLHRPRGSRGSPNLRGMLFGGRWMGERSKEEARPGLEGSSPCR